MREILFRGKRVDNGEWVTGDMVSINGETFIYCVPVISTSESGKTGRFGVSGYEVDPSTVGQYTGLTDENETRIFEGDVIKVKWAADGYQYRYVYYENGLFKARTKTDSYGDFFIVSLCSFAGFDGPKMHCEVVGNVFDNADLLK